MRLPNTAWPAATLMPLSAMMSAAFGRRSLAPMTSFAKIVGAQQIGHVLPGAVDLRQVEIRG